MRFPAAGSYDVVVSPGCECGSKSRNRFIQNLSKPFQETHFSAQRLFASEANTADRPSPVCHSVSSGSFFTSTVRIVSAPGFATNFTYPLRGGADSLAIPSRIGEGF